MIDECRDLTDETIDSFSRLVFPEPKGDWGPLSISCLCEARLPRLNCELFAGRFAFDGLTNLLQSTPSLFEWVMHAPLEGVLVQLTFYRVVSSTSNEEERPGGRCKRLLRQLPGAAGGDWRQVKRRQQRRHLCQRTACWRSKATRLQPHPTP